MKRFYSALLVLSVIFSSLTVKAEQICTGTKDFYNVISQISYKDMSYLPVDHWSNDAVYFMSALGAIKGSYGNFNYDGLLTKSEALALVFRVSGNDSTAEDYRKIVAKSKTNEPGKYNDIDSWADGYLRLAVDKDIISAEDYAKEISLQTEEFAFDRQAPCKRGEFAIWLVKALDFEKSEKLNYVLDYRELDGLSQNDKEYMEIVLKNGIINGDGNSLNINDNLTREQAAQVLFNAFEIYKDKLGIRTFDATIDDIETGTVVGDNGDILFQREIKLKEKTLVASNKYKMNGEAIDKDNINGVDYKDFVCLKTNNIPSDTSCLVTGDNIRCYEKKGSIVCITEFEENSIEFTHNDEDYYDASVFSGSLYYIDEDDRIVVIKNEKEEFVEIPFLADVIISNKNKNMSIDEANEIYKDKTAYVFTIVKKDGGAERAFKIQLVDNKEGKE